MLTYRKLIAKACLAGFLIALAAFLMGPAHGGVEALLLLVGVFSAATGKRGWALGTFILFPLLLTLNRYAFPMSGSGASINKVSMLIVAIVLLVSSSRHRGTNQLPLGGLFAYLAVAILSSAQGYFPEISYLKIVNFVAFILGIWIGTRNLQRTPVEMNRLRVFMLGVSIFVILGSFGTLAFPSVAYFQNMGSVIQEAGIEYADEVFRATKQDIGVSYFAGVTGQSQCLGPMLAALMNWVIADMLFVEKRLAPFHALLVVIGLGELVLTHSRTGMLAFACGAAILSSYVLKRVNLARRLRARVRNLVVLGVFLLGCAAIVSQLRGGGVTAFIRKGQTAESGESSLTGALVHSRLGLIEQNMFDFNHNPLLGCGFQVAYYHQFAFAHHKGLILSAPIEKGILPLMVLGEGGIVGLVVFLGFLVAFYAGCAKKHLFVTMALFTVLVMSNFGEADFFSPGGIGGAKWVLCVVGGFIIDCQLLYAREIERLMAFAAMEQNGRSGLRTAQVTRRAAHGAFDRDQGPLQDLFGRRGAGACTGRRVPLR